jgi:hypothetical protein
MAGVSATPVPSVMALRAALLAAGQPVSGAGDPATRPD